MSKFLSVSQDIEDFLTGCAFFGTGGGGDVKAGRASLNDCLEKGLEMALLDPAEIKEDGLYCSPFFMGSIAPKTPEVLAEMERNGFTQRKYPIDNMLIEAVRRMEKHIGRKVDGLMVAEMGGSNSACCMAAAYKMGLPVLDGDPAGRAIPEMSNGMFSIKGFSFLPAVYVDSWGNSSITTDASHPKAIERIGKFLSQAAYGEMAETVSPRRGAEIKEVIVPHSLSKAKAVGAAINRAIERGEDPLPVAADTAGGHVVARGIVHGVRAENAGGYYLGTYEIRGSDEYAGKGFKIWFKNENHVLWIDGAPHTTSPDLISLINLQTGTPLLNTYLADGIPVGVIVSPSCKNYREPRAIAAFGPRSFGFNFDYVPFAGRCS